MYSCSLDPSMIIEAWLLAKMRTGIVGLETGAQLEGGPLAREAWRAPVGWARIVRGPLLWERDERTGWEGDGCRYSRRLAALGMTYWADVTDMQTGRWLSFKQVCEQYGAKEGLDRVEYKRLTVELDGRANETVGERRGGWANEEKHSGVESRSGDGGIGTIEGTGLGEEGLLSGDEEMDWEIDPESQQEGGPTATDEQMMNEMLYGHGDGNPREEGKADGQSSTRDQSPLEKGSTRDECSTCDQSAEEHTHVTRTRIRVRCHVSACHVSTFDVTIFFVL